MVNSKISQMFTSIQGEGPYIGYKQLFIRFGGCNLKCKFCDTEFNKNLVEYSPQELAKYIQHFDLNSCNSISLTGGEPLLSVNFLEEFLPLVKEFFEGKIYLETNATLKENLEKIIDNVDIIAADIKLPSVSGVENSFALHDEFFKVAQKYQKEIFAKIVFDENILNDEIDNCIKISKKYNIPLILQPKTKNDIVAVSQATLVKVSDKFFSSGVDARLIPQVHVFLGLE